MKLFPTVQRVLQYSGVVRQENGQFASRYTNASIGFYTANITGIFLYITHQDLSIYDFIYMIGFLTEMIYIPASISLFLIQRTQIDLAINELRKNIQKSISAIVFVLSP